MQMALKRCFPPHQKHVDLKQGQAVKVKKMAQKQAKPSGPILGLRCLSRSGRKGWKKWKVVEVWRPGRRLFKRSTRQALLKQCKDKLRNLKQAYKDAKTNNSQTGRVAKTSPFFDVFEEVLGSRSVVKMPGVLQSCSESTTSNSPSSSKSSHADSSNSDGDADSSPKEEKKKKEGQGR